MCAGFADFLTAESLKRKSSETREQFVAVAWVISGVYGCATRAGRARRPRFTASCTSYTSCTRVSGQFSFCRSRENPRYVPAAFRLFIAPDQFAIRFHRSKQLVCFIGITDVPYAVNIARPDAFRLFVT